MAPSWSQDGQVGAQMEPTWEGILCPSCLNRTQTPPSSDSSPLVKPLRGAPATTPHAQAEPELSGTEDKTAAGLRPAAVMSSVETG